jgi:hypothetical protein
VSQSGINFKSTTRDINKLPNSAFVETGEVNQLETLDEKLFSSNDGQGRTDRLLRAAAGFAGEIH